ncbi:hypothetical protein RND81_02G193000 [Saponaria officinalis]|uniref:Uncharacterized protein n=1 Tax=Saponaria officinalis TaxID=3572 RepID=A0AAW1MUQ7_SAPOF
MEKLMILCLLFFICPLSAKLSPFDNFGPENLIVSLNLFPQKSVNIIDTDASNNGSLPQSGPRLVERKFHPFPTRIPRSS